MRTRIKIRVLVAAICGLMFLLAPVAHATITTSVAEVRGEVAFVKGSGANRKENIFWEGGIDPVTRANGKGNFSFEGVLPGGCPPDNCVGILTGDDRLALIPVTLYYDETNEPPGEMAELAVVLDAHDGDAVRAVGFIADGADGQIVSGGADAYLRNWTWTLDPSELAPRDLDHILYDLDVSADQYIVATGVGGWKGHAGSDTLRIWTWDAALAQTPAPIGFVYSVAVSPVAISPSSYWVAASGFYGDILVYGPPGLTLYSTTATKKKRTQALDFSHGGSLVASASTGGIQLRSFPDDCALDACVLDLLVTLNHPGSWVFRIAFAPTEMSGQTELVSGTDSGTIKIWTINHEDLATEDPIVPVRSVDSGAVYSLAWSPNGAMIVAGGNGDITVYDSQDLSILFRKEDAHAGRVNDVAFSPDTENSLIVSGGADGALKLWTFPAPES
jgi:WD40 repeat protein